MLFFRNHPVKLVILLSVSGIDPVITDHFKLSFGDMPDQPGDKLKGRNGFCNKDIIFMPVVVESNGIPVIGVNARSGNHRAAKISANVFENRIRLAVLIFGINIETVFEVFVDGSLTSLKGVAEMLVEQVQQSSAEGESEEREVEVFYHTPGDIVAGSAFGNEAMDMRVPFKVTTKGMKDADKAGSEEFLLIDFMEHTKNNTADSRKEAVQKVPVRKEKVPEFFGDGKDTMPMSTMDKFKGHRGSALNGIFVTAGRAEAAVAAKGAELKEAASRAGVKNATKGGVATAQHFINILNDSVTGM